MRTDSHLSVDTSRGEKLQINVSCVCLLAPCMHACMHACTACVQELPVCSCDCEHGTSWMPFLSVLKHLSCCTAQLDVTFPAMPCGWISLDVMGEVMKDMLSNSTTITAAGRLTYDDTTYKVLRTA